MRGYQGKSRCTDWLKRKTNKKHSTPFQIQHLLFFYIVYMGSFSKLTLKTLIFCLFPRKVLFNTLSKFILLKSKVEKKNLKVETITTQMN